MARGSTPGSRRMAPSTARSASRLCGGILPGSSTSAAMLPSRATAALIPGDRHRQRRRDVVGKANGHLVLAQGLDRLLQLHPALLDHDLVPLQELDDVLG